MHRGSTRSGVARWVGVVVATLALTLGSVTAPAFAAPSDNARILADTNAARAKGGLPALRASAAMDAVAQAWAVNMSVNGFRHNPSYSTQIPPGWTRASENIAYGYTSATVVPAWVNSPGHYANIMSSATDVGIGYYVDAGGRAWSVQNFGQYATAPPAPAPPKALTTAPTPVISGSTTVGKTLTVLPGAWAPAPVALSVQWKRSGVAISGATALTYRLAAADTGKSMSVTVTGRKSGYTAAARTSVGSTIVRNNLTAAPTPKIYGIARVGQTLTASPGTWSPAPVTLTYRWNKDGRAIPYAVGRTYVVKPTEVGSVLTVTVTGARTNYVTLARVSAGSLRIVVLP